VSPQEHGHSTRPANPGPLVQAHDSLGTVQSIAFGYLAEASAGACDLIKSVADELAGPEVRRPLPARVGGSGGRHSH